MTEIEAHRIVSLFREQWDKNSKTPNAHALDVAINALEKQEKIKEAFEIWKYKTGGYYCADDETLSLIRTLKKILRSDEE